MGEKLEKETYTGFDAALDEEQQMQEGKYKKAEKYYDSVFGEVETESLPFPDVTGKTPEKGYLERKLTVAEDKILSCCEKLGGHTEYFIYRCVWYSDVQIFQFRRQPFFYNL